METAKPEDKYSLSQAYEAAMHRHANRVLDSDLGAGIAPKPTESSIRLAERITRFLVVGDMSDALHYMVDAGLISHAQIDAWCAEERERIARAREESYRRGRRNT